MNQHYLRITDKCSIPESLEIDNEYTFAGIITIEKIEKASNGDGFDFTHKAKFTSHLELQKGDKVFKGTKKSSISQKMRNRAYIASNEQGIDHDTYYEQMGNKIIRYWDLVDTFLKDKS